ncbi:glycogen synthase GlgA [Achromobacter insuavis]|uniref:glycogen synthase GlgA n=1 Tax=Achromobacter insuavis TaxID=1287735 RepID=UPI001F147DC2|nr:glycogen synthase GlgA [Achromobacter insuavis]
MATTSILIVAAEAFPLAKTGGLGDAITGMARALAQAQTRPTLLLPAYRGVAHRLRAPRPVARLAGLPGGDAQLLAGECPQSGLSFLLLENDALYDRDGLYLDDSGQPYGDNALRYAALSHAAVRIAQGLPGLPRPDVVHAHDWHAALIPLLLRAARVEDVKSVLTIHNLAFQGQAPIEDAPALGIAAPFCGEDGAQAWGQLNFMKAGIRYADRITTVSQRYAREILTPEFGCGLDGVLRERVTDLVAIPNGIDTQLWNPTRDPHLGPLRYGPANLANKRLCKAAAQHEYGLREDPEAVLLIMCSRLTGQKMADVAAQSLPQALDAHPQLQVAVLGQGERHLESALRDLGQRYPRRCAVRIGYDEARAHRLHAAGDVLLHGSRFEPFGLTPLYAMRYGTLPIGSRVGGMADTIADPGPQQPLTAMTRATGVLFDGSAPAEMTAAIARAVRLRGHATVWRAMQRNAMTADFSWRPAMAQYLALFDSLSGHPEAPASAAPQAATAGAAAPPRRARQSASLAAPVPL